MLWGHFLYITSFRICNFKVNTRADLVLRFLDYAAVGVGLLCKLSACDHLSKEIIKIFAKVESVAL